MNREFLYAEVVFSIPVERRWHYVVPPDMADALRPGRLVLAPMGKNETIGCVVAVGPPPPEVAERSLRPLIRFVSPDFEIDASLRELARFLADYYLCAFGEALAAVSMIGFGEAKLKTERFVALAPEWREAGGGGEAETVLLKGAARRRILEALRASDAPEQPVAELLTRAKATRPALDPILAAGAARAIEHPVAWRPRRSPPPRRDTPLALTPRQTECFEAVARTLDERRFAAFLLQGVTGSGKTEIYLRAIQHCLDQGRQAICLVPEVALTPQTLERFQARFGAAVGVRHGRMTRPEKLRLYRAIRNREVNIVVGPRSAVFSPMGALGLIVVDEEHESAYKQDETPRYNARDVSIVRAKQENAIALLGSATPSLESLANVQRGKYQLLELPERIDNRPLPKVELVDMGEELREGRNPGLFSKRLETAIENRLDRGEQTILLLNRRGFANFLLCPHCGHLPRCTEDDVALTYHVGRPHPDAAPEPKGRARTSRPTEKPPHSPHSPRAASRAAAPKPAKSIQLEPVDLDSLQTDLFAGLWSPDFKELRRAKGRSSDSTGRAGETGLFGRAAKPKSAAPSHETPDAADPTPETEGGGKPNVGPEYLAKNVRDRLPGLGDDPQRRAWLACHLCGRKSPIPPRCPQCADPRLAVVGQGTQQLEEEIAQRFPAARLLRMDTDTMTHRDAYDDAWGRIKRGEVDIILGTQMIAKGLHLEGVTLVGVVLADVGLFVPDFRAGERTFSLLTQVAGRTGRGARGGEVIVQTYVPRNASIECAMTHDIAAFAKQEMKRRRWLRFPPVTRLAALTFQGAKLDAVLEASSLLAGIFRRRRHRDEHLGCTVLGPMPAPLARLKGRWRQRLLLRGEQPGPLNALLRSSLEEYESRPHPTSVRVIVDVDPMDLM